jgi:hypothetical protein
MAELFLGEVEGGHSAVEAGQGARHHGSQLFETRETIDDCAIRERGMR